MSKPMMMCALNPHSLEPQCGDTGPFCVSTQIGEICRDVSPHLSMLGLHILFCIYYVRIVLQSSMGDPLLDSRSFNLCISRSPIGGAQCLPLLEGSVADIQCLPHVYTLECSEKLRSIPLKNASSILKWPPQALECTQSCGALYVNVKSCQKI